MNSSKIDYHENMNATTANVRAAPGVYALPQHRQRVTIIMNSWAINRKRSAPAASPVAVLGVYWQTKSPFASDCTFFPCQNVINKNHQCLSQNNFLFRPVQIAHRLNIQEAFTRNWHTETSSCLIHDPCSVAQMEERRDNQRAHHRMKNVCAILFMHKH